MAPPKSFIAKKHKILSALSSSEYVDKSPKGSVDEPIRDLIDLINSHPGWCTTSSCSGRVAVFVEGPKRRNDLENGEDGEPTPSPGGKGGGHWLFVSHDPITPEDRHKFGLNGSTPSTTHSFPASSSSPTPSILSLPASPSPSPRLINLTFAPLILHILCASLDDAKPLLVAAINAGFRESGVQSLKALDKPEAGVMVAIRTAGTAYSTMVGVIKEGPEEIIECLVTDEYLKLCVNVVNERFAANDARKTRLEAELKRVVVKAESSAL